MCDDGTFCPDPNNITCCFNHQGIKEIRYNYTAPLPSIAASLSEFYSANGYQIATITSTQPTQTLSVSTSVSPKTNTAPPSTSTIASQTKPIALSPAFSTEAIALPSTSSDKPPTDQRSATSGLNSSKRAALGVGITVGVSLAGIVLYLLVRRLRRQHQRDRVHSGTSTDAEVILLGSERYEKPELTAEDAQKGLEAAERRGAELAGGQTGIELEATAARDRV